MGRTGDGGTARSSGRRGAGAAFTGCGSTEPDGPPARSMLISGVAVTSTAPAVEEWVG
ncbi:hypothetical protein LCD36_27110 [Saccharopolyspora sp. 6T]|uniref:hypothetical protein n=1 Tax=Saccharopolyspora sp. 6T TaxID=2877238 RepID=UPI001CD5FA71|nr:hypothetical protein [Saccharopolyspora sp. 6T]MCA1190089.1 hypothetical protein [Saccharopolyspora sp. 6T]